MNLFTDAGATFSPCGAYRYRLWRRWAEGAPLVFVMLNPSTADAERNDPTVERCQRRAVRMGFPAVEVVNLFALRSTDPAALSLADDPIGPGSDAAILEAARGAGMVVCAWGTTTVKRFEWRAGAVAAMLRADEGLALYALGTTKSGAPRHPLYLPDSSSPKPWS